MNLQLLIDMFVLKKNIPYLLINLPINTLIIFQDDLFIIYFILKFNLIVIFKKYLCKYIINI